MFATMIGSGIATCIIYGASTWQVSDRRKIGHVFANVNYSVKGRTPRLIKRKIDEDKTQYIYSVPYGLIDDDRLERILSKTLARPVKVMFRGKLIIYVYNNALSTQIKHDWSATTPWVVPIGQTLDGPLLHNFDVIPHMTVAGATRQGKTVFTKLLFAHLINGNPDVEFYVLDLKGGLEFGRYDKLRQVHAVASDVIEALECLAGIVRQMKADMRRFKDAGYNNIVNTPYTYRKFILVDEGAELDVKCQAILSEIARVGGALGYRIIFATQYPTADTLPRQLKQNADAKVSFRLPTEIASRVAIDEGGAELLRNPGRAIYRTHERHEVQVPYVSDEEISEVLRRYRRVEIAEQSHPSRRDIIEFN